MQVWSYFWSVSPLINLSVSIPVVGIYFNFFDLLTNACLGLSRDFYCILVVKKLDTTGKAGEKGRKERWAGTEKIKQEYHTGKKGLEKVALFKNGIFPTLSSPKATPPPPNMTLTGFER